MNNKNKNTSKRKDSHSREHTSHLRSSSKSTEKSKHRSDSKLILRLKHHDTSQLNTSQDPRSNNAHAVNPSSSSLLTRINTAKKMPGSTKQVQSSSNEYYNPYHRVKSKSKGKLAAAEQQIKAIYLNSIYMHKEPAESNNVSHHQHLKNNLQEDNYHSSHMANKIRMIERNGAIDANGKFVVKEHSRNHHDHTKNADSQQTISIYEGERKRPRKKEKTRKQIIKTKKKEETTAKIGQTSRLAGVKSADKFVKKQPKDLISPSMQNHTLRHYDCELNQTHEFRDNPYKIKDREDKAPPAPILSTRTSKTILSEQTQTSPQLPDSHPPAAQQINMDYIIRQLTQDKALKLPVPKLKQVYGGMQIQRVKCIQFLSKLCLSLSIRRQAHSLAIIYLDRFILFGQQAPKELRFVAMTALLLALKVDDGIMSRKLCHQYTTRMEMILSMSTKSSNKSKSIMKYKEAISAFSSKESSAALNKSKSMNSSELGITKQAKKSRREEGAQSKEMAQILQLQLDMLMRFNFRLVHRSTTYWADVLTLLWDDYAGEEAAWEVDLLFRSDRNRRNISHCYQILERVALDLQSYQHSPPLLTLSAMYLVLRMRLQQQRQGQQQSQIYSRYASSLAKSTNLIFYDAVGVNELFGDFLGQLEMNLSEIIECIQFVGKTLTVPLKTFSFSSRSQYVNCRAYEHQLSIYEGNPEIYKFVEDQY